MPQSPTPIWRPRSLQQLVLISFLLVAAPLMLIVYLATSALLQQSSQARELAQQSLEVTRRGQQLEHLAEDITRSARQFTILSKPEIAQRLQQQLQDYQLNLQIHAFILQNRSKVELIQQQLHKLSQSDLQQISLLQKTRELNQDVDQLLQQRLERLNQTAQSTYDRLLKISLFLIALDCLLIWLFSQSITQPVKQVASRIRALGTGETPESCAVGGPQEFIKLEQQLDWLTQRLSEVEQEKLRFLRHMSHELKTPLTTLREGSDLLADQITGQLNPSQMEITQLLQHNARQLQSLIEQLLDYNRLHQNEPVNIHRIELLGAIEEALEPYKLQLEQKKVVLELPEKRIHWHSDRAMLIRILSNLISNAAQYGHDKGHLQITAVESEQTVEIQVINSGPTIPDQDIPHLFQPFYQGHNKRLGPVKGSGIGLSIVHDAAEALSAHVELSTNSKQKVGFSLKLPAMEMTSDE